MMRLLATAMLACLTVLLPGTGCRRAADIPAAAPGETRIVSLAPNLTEILFAIGAGNRLVGRTDVCNWPPEARTVPVVGSFGRPIAEAILRTGATLVLSVDLEDASLLAPLEAVGIRHCRIACRKLDDIPGAIRVIGDLAGAGVRAARLADELRAGIAALRAAMPADVPSAFVEIWGDPLMTAGRRSFVTELVRLAGCSNIAEAVDAEYFTVSPEWVLTRNPDHIFCLYMGQPDASARRFAQRTGWQALRAVQAGAVHDGFNTDLLYRPGPRVLDGIAALRARVAEMKREHASTDPARVVVRPPESAP